MTVGLVKSHFWYLFKPVNYVYGGLVFFIRAGWGCVRIGETIWNTSKVGGTETMGMGETKDKDLKKECKLGQGMVALKRGGLCIYTHFPAKSQQ